MVYKWPSMSYPSDIDYYHFSIRCLVGLTFDMSAVHAVFMFIGCNLHELSGSNPRILLCFSSDIGAQSLHHNLLFVLPGVIVIGFPLPFDFHFFLECLPPVISHFAWKNDRKGSLSMRDRKCVWSMATIGRA